MFYTYILYRPQILILYQCLNSAFIFEGKDVHQGLFYWFLAVFGELYIVCFKELSCDRELKHCMCNASDKYNRLWLGHTNIYVFEEETLPIPSNNHILLVGNKKGLATTILILPCLYQTVTLKIIPE